MPPKPKFSREEIVAAALEIVREGGPEALTARAVGEHLGSSARPIFTVFENMDELSDAVYDAGRDEFVAFLSEALDYWPAFKEFGMRIIRYADAQPQIYRMLFDCRDAGCPRIHPFREAFAGLLDTLREEVIRAFGLNSEDADELVYQMTVFGVGMAHLRLNGSERVTDEAANRALGEVCIGMVLRFKVLDGSFDSEQALRMASNPNIVPRKREE